MNTSTTPHHSKGPGRIYRHLSSREQSIMGFAQAVTLAREELRQAKTHQAKEIPGLRELCLKYAREYGATARSRYAEFMAA